MKKMSHNQKIMLAVAGIAVALYVWYRIYEGNSSNASTTAATGADQTAASDYAALAAQEQADVAALQQEIGTKPNLPTGSAWQQAAGQIKWKHKTKGGKGGGGLTGIGGYGGPTGNTAAAVTGARSNVPALATGVQAATRSTEIVGGLDQAMNVASLAS